MELNVEDFEMQKWNIPTDRTQKIDKKWDNLSNYIYTPSNGH